MPLKGYKQTPEHKAKTILNLRPGGVLGMRWKIKDTSKMCGRHPKSEFKKGIKTWNTGLSGWLSEEHKQKLSIANKKPAWNKGLYGINSGELNPNWKGGYNNEEKRLRSTKQWDKWRLDVFKRDDYTCRRCAAKSGKYHEGTVYLEAHHELQVKDLFRNNMKKHIFNIDNGVTLCKPCHLFITGLQRRAS